MRLTRYVLEKRMIRSDALWTQQLLYRNIARLIPLFLDIWALSRSQYWPRATLDSYRDKRVRDLLSVARTLPFWAARVPGAARPDTEDWMRIPISTKAEMIGLSDAAIISSLVPYSEKDHTSGSTGRPLHFLQDWGAILRSEAVTERTFRALGPRVPIVYIRSRPRFGFTTYRQIWFFARSFTSIRYRLDDLRELALNLRGRFFLYAYTSWCVEIARILEQRGETLPVGAVMVAGEHLLPEDAALIRRAFGHDPYQLYASREVGFLAFECDARRLHLNEEWAYVEIVSKEGRRVEDGSEGRVVVTTFDNTVMPFIRYDTGDLGILSPDPCPCGRTLRTLHFTGRTSELITVAGGTSVALLDVAHALGGHIGAFQQYQIVQRGPVSFLIRHVPGPAFETHRDRIRALLVRMLHPEALIEFEAVDVISEAPSGKAVYFVREL